MDGKRDWRAPRKQKVSGRVLGESWAAILARLHALVLSESGVAGLVYGISRASVAHFSAQWRVGLSTAGWANLFAAWRKAGRINRLGCAGGGFRLLACPPSACITGLRDTANALRLLPPRVTSRWMPGSGQTLAACKSLQPSRQLRHSANQHQSRRSNREQHPAQPDLADSSTEQSYPISPEGRVTEDCVSHVSLSFLLNRCNLRSGPNTQCVTKRWRTGSGQPNAPPPASCCGGHGAMSSNRRASQAAEVNLSAC